MFNNLGAVCLQHSLVCVVLLSYIIVVLLSCMFVFLLSCIFVFLLSCTKRPVVTGILKQVYALLQAPHAYRPPAPATASRQLPNIPNQTGRWSADHAGNEYVIMELVPLGSLDKILAQFGHFLRSSAKFQVRSTAGALVAGCWLVALCGKRAWETLTRS